MKQHEQEVAALEASFEAEEARHTAEINKKLNETHMENVQQAHRTLLDKVSGGVEWHEWTSLIQKVLFFIIWMSCSLHQRLL